MVSVSRFMSSPRSFVALLSKILLNHFGDTAQRGDFSALQQNAPLAEIKKGSRVMADENYRATFVCRHGLDFTHRGRSSAHAAPMTVRLYRTDISRHAR
jgi:hypothetical protein